jgi:hypothetical protein
MQSRVIRLISSAPTQSWCAREAIPAECLDVKLRALRCSLMVFLPLLLSHSHAIRNVSLIRIGDVGPNNCSADRLRR